MSMAIYRKDLLDNGFVPRFFQVELVMKKGIFVMVDWSKSFECWCPEIFEDEEFNLFLSLPGFGIVRVPNIDFDFVEDKPNE